MPKAISGPEFADLALLSGTRFLITVDTEEEFDWSGPFTRDQFSIGHIPAISRFQSMCEEDCVQPVYLVDYPIAGDPEATELLGGYAAQGTAVIGMQLHPWVNPPFDETLSRHNSYACNLPPELEREKLQILHAKIAESFGVQPDIYRAGRYGAGPETSKILAELGVAIDSSVRSHFDYSAEGGPDFSHEPLNPYWLQHGQLLELPVTTVFRGGLQGVGKAVFADMFASETSRSILARTGLLERVALTPEGIPLGKAVQGIDCAIEQGVGILNFSFHSPSLEPGHTDYWWEGVFAHLAKRGVQPVNIAEIKAALFR